MGKYYFFILLFSFLLLNNVCVGQSETNIANTSIELKGNQVHITYDILNSSKTARFEVWVEISDADGNNLEVNALEGDIGEEIKSGKRKVIIWDPDADSIFLNARIDIQVYANMILPPPEEPEPEIQAQVSDDNQESRDQQTTTDQSAVESNLTQDDLKPNDKEITALEEPLPEQKSDPSGEIRATKKIFNRTGIILQSAAFPGLGLSRLNGKPHWIKGVAGYGCIAGAIVFNKIAVRSYEEYGAADSPEDATSLFSTTTTQDYISQGLAYAAIAIWVTDLTWTFIGTSELNKAKLSGRQKGISIDTKLDMISNTPLLSFKYTF